MKGVYRELDEADVKNLSVGELINGGFYNTLLAKEDVATSDLIFALKYTYGDNYELRDKFIKKIADRISSRTDDCSDSGINCSDLCEFIRLTYLMRDSDNDSQEQFMNYVTAGVKDAIYRYLENPPKKPLITERV